MHRCIQLAENGRTGAPPNPVVGAVLVCDDRIIGEGYHIRCGQPHAEVHAIASVADRALLRRSTLYVSLEPCSHYGRTPPCADLIVREGIPRVVIGCADPFPRVQGRGIARLREAGCQVTVGVCEEACKALNRRFFTFHLKQRPYVTLKWAQSADGFLDLQRCGGNPVRLSTSHTLMEVHRLRAAHQAILVGRRTAELDNPLLTVRHWPGCQPLRVVLAGSARLSPALHLFDGKAPTLVVCRAGSASWYQGMDGLSLLVPDEGRPWLPQLMARLYQDGIQTLLVEGGRTTTEGFITQNLWDEAVVEHSDARLGDGVPAPVLPSGCVCRYERKWGVTFQYAAFSGKPM